MPASQMALKKKSTQLGVFLFNLNGNRIALPFGKAASRMSFTTKA
jgi:hypothetical protein